MSPSDPKLPATHAFVRNLNTLLRFVLVYGPGHARTKAQFAATWNELQMAVPITIEAVPSLDGRGSHAALGGMFADGAYDESNFVHLVSAAGVASIDFTTEITKDDLTRLVQAFSGQSAEPLTLAERVNFALLGPKGIRINLGEITPEPFGSNEPSRPVPDAPKSPHAIPKASDQRTRRQQGSARPATDKTSSPAVAESAAPFRQGASPVRANTPSPRGRETGPRAGLFGIHTPSITISCASIGGVASSARHEESKACTSLSGSGATLIAEGDDGNVSDIQEVPEPGRPPATGEADSGQPEPAHDKIRHFFERSREVLRQAIAEFTAQKPEAKSQAPVSPRPAERPSTQPTLNRAKPPESKAPPEKTDQEFWAAVPEKGKRSVLCSSEAWCVPALNVKQYVEEILHRGDSKGAQQILKNYASGLQSQELEARRRTASGLTELADVTASAGEETLAYAIHTAGAQLASETEQAVQDPICTSFLRMAELAGKQRMFPCLLQVMYALDSLEHHNPALARSLRPRIAVEKRAPELVEEGLRGASGANDLVPLLRRMPRAAAQNMVARFNQAGNRADRERLVDLGRAAGEDVVSALQDILRAGTPAQATETVGLLSWLDSSSLDALVPKYLRDWPRTEQDRAVRLLATAGASDRGRLLTRMLTLLDPVLVPLALDEIGLTEDVSCAPTLLKVARGHLLGTAGEYVRLKALEALGRLKAHPAADLFREIAEARHMFHWEHPSELRLVAAQSLAKMDRQWAKDFLPHSGFSAAELSLASLDSKSNPKWLRRRRYSRVRLPEPMAATATAGQGWQRLEIRGLSLGGGSASGVKQLQPGALATLKIGSGIHPIRALVLVRETGGEGLGFEIADMDLEERARLRKLLLENTVSNGKKGQAVHAH